MKLLLNIRTTFPLFKKMLDRVQTIGPLQSSCVRFWTNIRPTLESVQYLKSLTRHLFRGTKQLVSVNTCSLEGHSIFVIKVSP